MPQQLPLSLTLKRQTDFSTFLPGRNQEAIAALSQLLDGVADRFLYLWGAPGVGKTHLLQATCIQASRLGQTPAYLPLSRAGDFTPQILEDLEQRALICLDDIQEVGANSDWEQGLFNLFNRVRDAAARLVISGNCTSARLPLQLGDLKSRIGWGPAYRIHSLDDDDRLRFLVRAGHGRGLSMDRQTAGYLLRHCPRDMKFLERLLDHLDQYSLAAQRPVTIPLVKEALAVMPADTDPSERALTGQTGDPAPTNKNSL